MFYVFFFGTSIGSVSWLYIAEIMPSKAMSIPLFLNQAVVVAVSFLTPIWLDISVGGTFTIFSIMSIGGALFALLFLKETKGKTREETHSLYSVEKKV